MITFSKKFRHYCVRQAPIGLMIAVLAITLTGCGSLPSAGPSIGMIEKGADTPTHPSDYVVLPITQGLVNTMRAKSATTDSGASAGMLGNGMVDTGSIALFGDVAPQKITAGDVVGVSIYTAGGGLFSGTENPGAGANSSSEGTVTTLPPQLVDASGAITVPHVEGAIAVAGKTPFEVGQDIAKALAGKAYAPSVIVSLQARHGSDLLTVTGDVKYPVRVEVPMSGLRVLDALTTAGGSMAKDYETLVLVLRGDTVHADMYRDIMADPKKNASLQAGDTIMVKTKPWSYTTLGATGQSLHPFPTEKLSAEEALASVTGIDDNRGNPEAVFVYRFEPADTVKSLGVSKAPNSPLGVPVIYQLNLRQPDGFFLAKQFAMRDKDIIFVGNAGSIGIIKAMNIVGSLTSPAVAGLSATAGAGTLVH